MQVSFKMTAAELALIEGIADRAEKAGLVFKNYNRRTLMMDLSACNANGCPMDFERLLAAPDFDFTHDICGIARHMNRETGQLGDCFLPRTHRRELAA